MTDLSVNLDSMVSLRHSLHEIAEGGFECFNTQALLKKTLLGLGVEEKAIKESAKSGLVVDIWGAGEE